MRTTLKHSLKNSEIFKTQLLHWAQQFDDIVWLDSNNYPQNLPVLNGVEISNFDAILAVEAFTGITTDYYNAFENLKEYQTITKDWIFGYLSYDLKNDVENLHSKNFDGLKLPELYFFQPKKLFLLKDNNVELHYLNCVDDTLDSDFKDISLNKAITFKVSEPVKIKLRTHKEAYFKKLDKVLDHIQRGDIYEANFCQEFYAENKVINPLTIYNKLNKISKPPFATFLKQGKNYLMSASPERYLKKSGHSIVSQPIKGTAKRSLDSNYDLILKNNLVKNKKERSENIMIVDLVRNDLSLTAKKGSVTVKELCKVYTFPQVHQMISTITSEIDITTHPVDVIKTTFPMGSMTGAPKISAMKIIEDLEDTKRGLYSGAVGYFTPEGDFDFNVVIRSIIYNASKKYVSYSVGSAITAKSDPLKEYEECLIKAKAMREVLEN
ncbi:anthranilate synthase component I family protein [Ichthyenterobacterium sp. W332]|uniref:Anthranilate synthase component I family protein n=1 Tax=Microcosmobacter mediterraneus TaxID=3075607 RepID=A0ABU2YKR6_9FLAO|nr:anthranilate synthase component I family protein [Ichthyenterobacterium sp. W332]MDT0558758.1 anthranilate synthase component I family protein [Ichthyenterobacterium sp. W332]